MTHFRTVLIAMTILIVVFTITAVADGGFDLFTPFVEPILAMGWQGQFHLDFVCYLVLSGMWMAWRGGFSGRTIALGILAPPIGILFFAPYLIYQIGRAQGDVRRLLLGVHA